jgi:hypothetical protein
MLLIFGINHNIDNYNLSPICIIHILIYIYTINLSLMLFVVVINKYKI